MAGAAGRAPAGLGEGGPSSRRLRTSLGQVSDNEIEVMCCSRNFSNDYLIKAVLDLLRPSRVACARNVQTHPDPDPDPNVDRDVGSVQA